MEALGATVVYRARVGRARLVSGGRRVRAHGLQAWAAAMLLFQTTRWPGPALFPVSSSFLGG